MQLADNLNMGDILICKKGDMMLRYFIHWF